MFVERSTQYTSISARKQPANAGTECKQFIENASVVALWHFSSPYWRMRIQNALLLDASRTHFLDAMFLSCLSLTTLIHARIHTKKLLITAQPFRNFCGCWCPQKWTNGVSYSRCFLHSLPSSLPPYPLPLLSLLHRLKMT